MVKFPLFCSCRFKCPTGRNLSLVLSLFPSPPLILRSLHLSFPLYLLFPPFSSPIISSKFSTTRLFLFLLASRYFHCVLVVALFLSSTSRCSGGMIQVLITSNLFPDREHHTIVFIHMFCVVSFNLSQDEFQSI
jgi:hypothetical protein